MSIEAKVHAPTASFAERAALYGAAGTLVALGLAATNTFPIASTLLLGGLWIWLVSPFLLRRPQGTHAHIECDGGKIRVRPDRMLARTIKTRELHGASVARTDSGAVVTLSGPIAQNPIAIEVRSAEAANEIRSALGVPHGGFGEIAWHVEPKSIDISLMFTRVAAAALLVLRLLVSPWSTAIGAVLSVLAISATVVAILLALVRLVVGARALGMRSSGILAVGAGAPIYLPFAEIRDIVDDGKALVFRPRQSILDNLVIPCAPTRWLPSGLSAEERALMIAQLRGAIAVAKGESAPFVDPASHLDALKRNDATPADWLARLDALASQHANAAYRSTTIAKEDLWRALESHDAGAEMRAGAARVLLRISPEKEQDRIAKAIDSIHDDDERAHIRAALRDDVEEAAVELQATVQRIDPSRR